MLSHLVDFLYLVSLSSFYNLLDVNEVVLIFDFLLGEGAPYGVDINTGGIANTIASFVWEPAVVKVIIDLLLSDFYLST